MWGYRIYRTKRTLSSVGVLDSRILFRLDPHSIDSMDLIIVYNIHHTLTHSLTHSLLVSFLFPLIVYIIIYTNEKIQPNQPASRIPQLDVR